MFYFYKMNVNAKNALQYSCFSKDDQRQKYAKQTQNFWLLIMVKSECKSIRA